jgi:hypothetical protein
MHAALLDQRSCALSLVDHGAALNAQDAAGKTALMLAVVSSAVAMKKKKRSSACATTTLERSLHTGDAAAAVATTGRSPDLESDARKPASFSRSKSEDLYSSSVPEEFRVVRSRGVVRFSDVQSIEAVSSVSFNPPSWRRTTTSSSKSARSSSSSSGGSLLLSGIVAAFFPACRLTRCGDGTQSSTHGCSGGRRPWPRTIYSS